ncbi:MAG: sulfate transporter CysZ [Nitrospirota bacterium]
MMNILRGATYVFRGYGLITRPGLRRFVVAPLLVNMLIFASLLWLGIDQFGNLTNLLLPSGESWWAALGRFALWLLFAAAALLIIIFTFTLLANLVAAPFNGLLSEKVEEQVTGTRSPRGPGGLRASVAGIIPSLVNELRKLIYFLLWGGLLFLLSLVPVLNALSPFLWIAFTSWMLAVEYLSYPMENNGLTFNDVRKRVTERRAASLGFGFAVLCAMMIPFVNFLVMPAAVAGATALWAETWRDEKQR